MLEWLFDLISPLQGWLFEHLVLPALFRFGFMHYADEAHSATGLALLGLIELAAIYAVLRPLEWWRPVERWRATRAVRTDVLYTFLYRSGLLPLAFFFVLQPLLNPLDIELRVLGWLPPNLEELVPLLGTQPLLAFLAYLVIIDFADYWRHRFQHRFEWWWALHSVHQSQRQMTLWTDDRNHVLDGLIHALWLALLAILIGVPGNQFLAIVLLTRVVESLSHTNVRISFGAIGDRFLVSPRYHRVHHGIGVGHEGTARGCNFATLFPLWDVLFGTANFRQFYPATGIADQLRGGDYGVGFLRQQGLGIARLWRTVIARQH